jgi:hypothetical protein
MNSRVALLRSALTALLAIAPLACSSTTVQRASRGTPAACAAQPSAAASAAAPAAQPPEVPEAEATAAQRPEPEEAHAEGFEDFADDEALEEEERKSYVRQGFFASRDQALARGVHVIGVQQADVDLDGRMDEVLALLPADGSSARQGCVIARSTPRGWTATLLTSNIGSLNTDLECGAPVRAGDTVFLRTTMIFDGGREFGPDAHRVEQLYVVDSPASVKVVGYVEAAWPAGGPLRVEAAGADALLVVAQGPRYAQVRWDAARGEASVSGWSDRAP